jgi:prevent-host-death family protein
MTKVNVHEAKTNLSKLLEKALKGEEVVIARSGKPIIKLVPIDDEDDWIGIDKGKIWIAKDFDNLPDDIVAAFEGNADESLG